MSKKQLPVIPPDRADDLHHLEIAESADLILFMAGNQFMAMKEIVSAFKNQYSEIKKIFYETLPPGLELKQILAEGAIYRDRVLNFYPDIYSSVNQAAMRLLEQTGHIRLGDYHLYLHNRLSLMVRQGNPAAITSVRDLGRDNVRISQPDPDNEDIAYHIIDMYRQAGGNALVDRIMKKKRAKGSTIFTVVHHRETPKRIAEKTVDVGPVWSTEALYAKSKQQAIDVIEPGAGLDQRDKINYYICRLKKSFHPQNAQKFIDFILSATAQRIYKKYGFVPYT